MSNHISSSALPSAMEKKLRTIRRRQVLLVIGRAIAVAVAVLLVGIIVAMAIDWSFTLFNPSVRVTLTALSLLLAAIALIMAGLPPLITAMKWMRAATDTDDVIPQLEERWTTVASFATSKHQPTSAIAEAMLNQVTSEAAAMETLVQPQNIARPAALKPAALTLAGCLLAFVGFLSLNWPQTSVLLQRFWSPTADIAATQITSLTGDVVVPRGETLELTAESSGLPRDVATLEIRHEAGLTDLFDLHPSDNQDSAFTHTIRVDNSMRYRLRAGDGQTAWHTVDVVDYPAFEEVRFTVTSPEYVDRPIYEKPLIPSRVKVIQGSQLNLQMKPVAALERLELTLSFEQKDEEPVVQTVTLNADSDGWYRFQMPLLNEMSLRPTMWNEHGLINEEQSFCRIQVIADKAPVARVVGPTDEMAVAVDDVIDIEFEAHDDFGIATAELVIYDETATKEGEEAKVLSVQPIPLGNQQLQQHVMAKTQLDLKKLKLQDGTQISYAIRVTDNRMVPPASDTVPTQLAKAKSNGEAHQQTDSSAPNERLDATAPSNSETSSQQPNANEDLETMLTDAGPRPTSQNKDDAEHSGLSIKGDVPIAVAEKDAQGDQPGNTSEATTSADHEATASEMHQADHTIAGNETRKELNALDATNVHPSEDSEPSVNSGRPPSEDSETEQPAPVSTMDEKPLAVASPDGLDADPENRQSHSSNSSPDSEQSESNTAAITVTADETVAADEIAHANADEMRPAAVPDNPDASPSNGATGSTGSKPRENPSSDSPDLPPQPRLVAMTAQQSESGQNTETGRQKLKITQRLAAVAASEGRTAQTMKLRDRVIAIDVMLMEIETGLTKIIRRQIPDADHNEQYRRLDVRSGDVEKYIADLREETRDGEYAFVGLQMVDIGRTHVTPARDQIFTAIRDAAGAARHATDALQHIVRAREQLAALLKRYDRVARDRELANSLDEAVTMYEVYVARRHQLMREARQNKNPLERKMAVIEVDQDYLDRYAEVSNLRRTMLAEFARMLGDDPRLLSRYLDQLKRRRSSLREQLSELSERQYELTTEVRGWQAVGEEQRDDLWRIIAEMRLQAVTPLASDAAELVERFENQLPLVLDPSAGTASRIVHHAREIARNARTISFEARGIIQRDEIAQSGETMQPNGTLTTAANQLVTQFGELDAALDQLNFEHESDEEIASYVTGRLLESRAVADQADAWAEMARHIEHQQYHGLAEVDQQKIAIATELLRIEMLEFEDDLEAQFQRIGGTDVPGDIIDMVRELHRVMEAITFHQAAATFSMARAKLDVAERRQAAAVAEFERAEELFDRIRRAVVAALDEFDEDDPNIANLQDPTLDEFLAQLEREPNIQAQLGIPNRPRNLRVITELMMNEQAGGDMLGDSEEAARQRARKAMRMQRKEKPDSKQETASMSDEEREEREKVQKMQEMLEKSLVSLQEKIDDPETTEQQRRQLKQMAQNMRRMLEQIGQPAAMAEEWERIAESDQAKSILQALARGQAIPDEQWNKLLSTLEDGLWQVRGRTPPEQYRKAIEQYQDRIRQLMDTIVDEAA